MPWLAAEGPLAYTPESPPARDYFFQYNWILPEIFSACEGTRGHHYFGASIRSYAEPLLEFWRQARRGVAHRAKVSLGSFRNDALCAPIALYRAKRRPYEDSDS